MYPAPGQRAGDIFGNGRLPAGRWLGNRRLIPEMASLTGSDEEGAHAGCSLLDPLSRAQIIVAHQVYEQDERGALPIGEKHRITFI